MTNKNIDCEDDNDDDEEEDEDLVEGEDNKNEVAIEAKIGKLDNSKFDILNLPIFS